MSDFEADRRICDAATPGPWKVGVGIDAECDECGETVSYSAAIIRRECNDSGICDVFVDDKDAENAAFIAAARDGWPKALDRIAELEAENTGMRAELQAAVVTVSNLTNYCKLCKNDDCRLTMCDCIKYWRGVWAKSAKGGE